MNPLVRATRGRIRMDAAKGALILAVAGLLFYENAVVMVPDEVTPPHLPPTKSYIPGAGKQRRPSYNKVKKVYVDKKHINLLIDDEEVINTVIKIWIQCQN